MVLARLKLLLEGRVLNTGRNSLAAPMPLKDWTQSLTRLILQESGGSLWARRCAKLGNKISKTDGLGRDNGCMYVPTVLVGCSGESNTSADEIVA